MVILAVPFLTYVKRAAIAVARHSGRGSCARSVLALLATSRNTLPAPAAQSWRTSASTLGPSVDTRASP